MSPFIAAEIAARIARIDPALGPARAAARLLAIARCLAAADRDASGTLDLLLEGAAVCSAAAMTERFAAAIAATASGGEVESRAGRCEPRSPPLAAVA